MKIIHSKKIVICLGIILYSFSCLAQQNFVSGYIIKLNGDTLKGFVDYRNRAKNPDKIKFKVSETSIANEYKPLEITAFAAKDDIYKSAIIKVDNSNVDRMSGSPVFEFRTDTTFLQTLFQGSKSLYFYKDKNDQDNFYIYNNSSYELLEFKKYIKRVEYNSSQPMAVLRSPSGGRDDEFLLANKRYVGQLNVYLLDCPHIEEKLKTIAYKEKSLQGLFEYYYSVNSNEKIVRKVNEGFRAELGLIAGISIIDLKFVSDALVFNPLPQADFENTLSFTSGLSVNVVIPRNNGKWSVYNEITYSAYKTTSKTLYKQGHYEDTHNYTVGYGYVKLNNMLRYKHPVGKMFVFTNAGFSNGIMISETNIDNISTFNKSLNVTTTKTDKIVTTTNADSFEAKTHELGLLFGVGATYNNFAAEFRFEAGTGMSKYISLNANANRYQFLIGYKF